MGSRNLALALFDKFVHSCSAGGVKPHSVVVLTDTFCTNFLLCHPVIAAAPFDNALLIWKRSRDGQRIFRITREGGRATITRANSLIGFHSMEEKVVIGAPQRKDAFSLLYGFPREEGNRPKSLIKVG